MFLEKSQQIFLYFVLDSTELQLVELDAINTWLTYKRISESYIEFITSSELIFISVNTWYQIVSMSNQLVTIPKGNKVQ